MAELLNISYPRREKAAMASFTNMKKIVGDLDKESFVSLLSKLIGESKYIQNNPPELIPQEDLAVKHVLDSLLPHNTTTGGGPLVIKHVTYSPSEGNVIVEYPKTVPGKILSFVGCHTDVVIANLNDWEPAPPWSVKSRLNNSSPAASISASLLSALI
ncbi:hypothetical protein DVH24_039755 [Malus domestica]|uniref:Peptidase M20 dimerisation domain-containing protein n=1 Tax=Malus domestica TaxID=3750 RepID=A0A498I6H7_MALDO|nr:hypothetical protein DVH24_039755 [Malus domestica]